MNDDLNLDLDTLEDNAEKNIKIKNRFEQLSEKVILTSKERDELAKAKETLEGEKNSLAKERDFYKDFSVNVSKYPSASEHQDQILEKVRAGYSTEDAMVAVLAKEGKLNMSSNQVQQPFNQPIGQVEGGSAPTAMSGAKAIQDMTPDEKFAALSGLNPEDLSNALRGK